MEFIKYVEHAAYYCRDLYAQVAWYTDVFGGENVLEHKGENVFLKIQGNIVLELIQADPKNFVELQGDTCTGLRHLCFYVDDIEKAKAYLESKGVKITGGFENKKDKCSTVFFRDPEGNYLQFMYRENPFM